MLGAAIDPSFKLIAVTPAYAETFASLFGAVPRVGDDLQALKTHRPELGLWRRKLWVRALAGEEVSTLLVADLPGQRRRFFNALFRPLRDGQGDVAAAVQVARDVTDDLFERGRLVESSLRSRDQRLTPHRQVRRVPNPTVAFARSRVRQS